MDKPEQKGLDPEHIFWLVENRSTTQGTAAHLFRLLRDHQGKLANPIDDDAQLLVGTAFSLWRAVFLASEASATNQSAIAFLGEVLQNNAIGYPQEFRTKDWTFRYYSNNAGYRLGQYAQRHQNAEVLGLLGRGDEPPKGRWEHLQRAFEAAVIDFEKRLLQPKP